MQILDHNQILQKVKRLSYQIAERNLNEKTIAILGINKNGLRFAKMVVAELSIILPDTTFILSNISLNPADPVSNPITVSADIDQLRDKSIIIIDDVANTGRTLYFALQPLMVMVPKCIEVAVLINREHKSFPINVDYQGLSLATTLKENIEVDLSDESNFKAFLN
ncbi:MAG: phosphoribosyltransferase family protein [Saprospiraceae bacterium]|nr:phosphoribosyltransferase family protein [Saprospiraceae bacterium]